MQFKVEPLPVSYPSALQVMEQRVNDIYSKRADEMLWLLEHPPIYTAGTSSKIQDLINAKFPVYKTGRGGEYTYHGPGQRIAYIMLDLKKRQKIPDIKQYVWQLEEWVIRSLRELDICGERREGRIGIWVPTSKGEKKIAAIGVRVRHWISYHGVSINLNPDLSHYSGIVPCGLSDYGVCSIEQLTTQTISMEDLDKVLLSCWGQVFEDISLAA